ncbi:FHA domain-containing protein, partial [archaeon]
MSSSDREDGKEADNSKVMRGMKIRDEFLCPITYELMREPVVASDGHTYEKNAIDKWLKTNHTSPRSGEPMDNLCIPNINLKKLIQDIINEGGAGFYTSDISNKDRIFEVCPEKVLILECLGPPESDWNLQSFQVNKLGCVGGRKHNPEDSANLREIVLFKDITVSRRHFEVTYDKNSFFLRDLGSAGGTFLRIRYGAKKQLHPGMIIL